MKNAETVTDDKGNVYIVPGQMTREEAEVYFPNQKDLVYKEPDFVKIEKENYALFLKYKAAKEALELGELKCDEK